MTVIKETITGMDQIIAQSSPAHLLSMPLKTFFTEVTSVIERRASENASKYTDTGQLAASITHQIDPEPIPLFGVVGTNLVYAPAAEFGRPAGKFPPIDAIQTWVHHKGIVSGYTTKSGKFGRRRGKNIARMERSVAYLIARKIFLHGSPARPFLRKAYADSQGDIRQAQERLAKAIGAQWGKP